MRAYKVLLLILSFPVASVAAHSVLAEKYKEARLTRVEFGHTAAQPLYAELLQRNPSDVTAATRLAAATSDVALTSACQHPSTTDATTELARFGDYLKNVGFSEKNIATMVGAPASGCAAPIYIKPAGPGLVEHFPIRSALHCLTALFLVGLAVPRECIPTELAPYILDLDLVHQCEYDTNLVYAPISIMPITVDGDRTIYAATDWHPCVLNTVKITEVEESVMYIGPDSMALVEHWTLGPICRKKRGSVLDLCSGSGVQALCCLAAGKCDRAVCVDLNPRALRFTAFSAALNGLTDAIKLVQGDLLQGTGSIFTPGTSTSKDLSLVKLLQDLDSELSYDIVVANPPFLPIDAEFPFNSTNSIVAGRHGLFSAGGEDGELVLAPVLCLSNRLLKENGFCAIVSEFFLRKSNEEYAAYEHLLHRLKDYWMCETDSSIACLSRGILFLNEFPISAAVYAKRRASSTVECIKWKKHLSSQGINSCSPGLLYVQKRTKERMESSVWKHSVVPKTNAGSIWSPCNVEGISATQSSSQGFFGAGQLD